MNEGDKKLYPILEVGIGKDSSDIHLKIGYRPYLRINGKLEVLSDSVITLEDMGSFIDQLFPNDWHRERLDKERNVDASYVFKSAKHGNNRLRLNAGYDDKGRFIIARVVPRTIRNVELPFGLNNEIITLEKGLVLVTGVTGSGKSTTLAALINQINQTRAEHIITIEDPIEYEYPLGKSIISQRELGKGVLSFADGVKYALRQDPDTILVGEIRDKETATEALRAAETGHLVFSTLHTSSAGDTTMRYANFFGASEQNEVRSTLAANLAYVICQKLIPYKKSEGRTLAMEILNVGGLPSVRKFIREGTDHRITDEIQRHRDKKMITMDQCLELLVQQKSIDPVEAIQYANNRDYMKGQMERYGYREE